jgi:hypothetical protein
MGAKANLIDFDTEEDTMYSTKEAKPKEAEWL